MRRPVPSGPVRRLVLAGGLVSFLLAIYATIRVVCWAAGVEHPGTPVWLTATVFVALVAPAARRRVEQLADRLAYGPGGDPHAVMTRFVQRIADTLAVDDVLPDLARTASQAMHSPGSEVRLWLADGGEWRQTWPPGRAEIGGEVNLALQHSGRSVGRLSVELTPDQLSVSDRELLDRLAGPAGLALSNVRLTYELRRRLRQETELAEQLRRSRHRLVEARAAQRRAFAAAVDARVYSHLAAADAALASVAAAADAALASVAAAADAALASVAAAGAGSDTLLDTARNESLGALEALRDLAVGVFPPALLDRRLDDALADRLSRLPARITLRSPGIDGARLAPVTGAAAYFCCVGLLDDMARDGPAVVDVALGHDELQLTVRSSNAPTPSVPTPDTEQLVRDRVEALGGTIEVRRSATEGVATVTLPVEVPDEFPPASSGPGDRSAALRIGGHP